MRLVWRSWFDRQGWLSRAAHVPGREIDPLLGTANPWLLAVGQFVPIALAARIGFYSAEVWLFYLTIFSTVGGAIAGQAAERSRGIWLCGPGGRAMSCSCRSSGPSGGTTTTCWGYCSF